MIDEKTINEMNKFGFGLMRLPKNDAEGKVIDVEQTSKMVDTFLDAGFKYFDTAYVYLGSEEAAKAALTTRHPRESFYITSKLNVRAAKTEEEAKEEFNISCQREGVDYIDFYLVHALGKETYQISKDWHIWEYVRELKQQGKIKHFGFSFHDTAEVLEQIIVEQPDVEFVQLQINYADWNSLIVQSRKCYEVCRKYNKPIIVMEPVKGGTLANPPKPIAELFKAANPDASYASWAIRFVASLPGVMVVLSGMSDMAQMEDNVNFMKTFKPLTEEEQEVIKKAQQLLEEVEQIPCTACHYCTEGCPMDIQIPDLFAAKNWELIYDMKDRAKANYARSTEKHGKASQCIQCGQCELQCPQHIEIRSWLEKIAATLED